MANKQVPINRINKFKVYGLFCPITNELRYVGITTQKLSARLSGHLRQPTNRLIGNWFNELGELKPIIKVLKFCSSYEELLNEEIKYISENRRLGVDLLNIADGGDINPMFGKTHTEEARNKISKARKGCKLTQKQITEKKELLKKLWEDEDWANSVKEKMSKNMLGNTRALGYVHTEETKKRLSEIHRGNTYSLGYSHSEETKMKMSENNKGENNPMFGKVLPKEVLERRSEKVKREGTFKGSNNPNFKFDIKEEELRLLFLVENLTILEISSIYGCSKDVINKNLRNYNIYKPKSNKYNLNVETINKYLNEGLTQVEIGKIYGCSNKIINKFIKKNIKYE